MADLLYALRGRVVTMNAEGTVLDDGVVYVNGPLIIAVQAAAAPPPASFEQVVALATGGSIYPGLIELHNHLPYDVLQLWQVPEQYTNRDQWGGTPTYHQLVTGPMTILGEDPQLMPAVVRYVEAKALINGTTTSQGIALFSSPGSRRMYQGVVRNVEQTGDPALPEATSRIADVEAKDAAAFLARLNGSQRLILHLAEGTDAAARAHFQALQYQPGQWAITDNLVGIHCAALAPEDFQVLAAHGGSMVWSPLSNLLLYGKTADVAAAKAAGLLIGLGSDWSVSGSKGLLGELKAARLASQAAGGVFTDQELVAMATRTAAKILRWDQRLGTLQPGCYADLLIVTGTTGDPYTGLVDATDADIALVTIAGTPRYGTAELMQALTPATPLEDPGPTAPAGRLLNLHDATADPVVAGLTLADATNRLTQALANLPTQTAAAPAATAPQAAPAPAEARWQLALDEIHPTGMELRPRLPLPDTGQASGPAVTAPAPGTGPDLVPLELDALTASRDAAFTQALDMEGNLTDSYRTALTTMLTDS